MITASRTHRCKLQFQTIKQHPHIYIFVSTRNVSGLKLIVLAAMFPTGKQRPKLVEVWASQL